MAYGGEPKKLTQPERKKWMIPGLEDAEVLILYQKEERLHYQVSKTVLRHFQKRKLKYIHPEEHFQPGEINVRMLSDSIEQCKKLLLIVSNFKNRQLSLEMLLALEKCQRTNCLNLIVLVLEDFDKRDLPRLPMLQEATFVRMNYNIQERCLDEIISHIKATTEMRTVLPAGNFSAGLAWSHYLGFLQIILPDLQPQIMDCEWFRNNIGRFSKRFFILLPRSARAPHLDSVDDNIKRVGQLPVAKTTVAGAVREYSVQVYMVSGPDGTQYFFCGEIPSAYAAISKIFERTLCTISAEQRNLEVERFSYVLQEILTHQLNQKCNQTAKIIMYNDEAKGADAFPSTHILKFVTEHEESSDEMRYDGITDKTTEKSFHTDVLLIYSEHDEGLANHVRYCLEDKKGKRLRVAIAKLPHESLQVIENRIKESRWIVLFVSQEAMHNSNCIPLWLSELLCTSVQEQHLRVIPYLVDIEPANLPNFIRSVTYITGSNVNHCCQRILQAVEGKDVKMDSQLPIGDVSYGLAWAFYVNYLQHLLPQIKERGKRKLEELQVKQSEVLFEPLVLELIPYSTECPDKLTDIESEDYSISDCGTVRPIEAEVAGIGRVFGSKMYKIKPKMPGTADKDLYFMGEYATPIRTLNLMSKSMIAGLSVEKARTQAREFEKNLTAILQSEKIPNEYKGTCKVILFDDKQENVLDAVVREVRNDSNNDRRRLEIDRGLIRLHSQT